MGGNAADNHFADESSLLHKPDTEAEHWSQRTAFLSTIIIYN